MLAIRSVLVILLIKRQKTKTGLLQFNPVKNDTQTFRHKQKVRFRKGFFRLQENPEKAMAQSFAESLSY